jgi:hypothetical protein
MSKLIEFEMIVRLIARERSSHFRARDNFKKEAEKKESDKHPLVCKCRGALVGGPEQKRLSIESRKRVAPSPDPRPKARK